MRRAAAILALGLTFWNPVLYAADCYVSPTGVAGNSCANSGVPKPLRTALADNTKGGADNHIKLMDGTYSITGSDLVWNCSSGAAGGTVGHPVYIEAVNETKAFIKSDGSVRPFQINTCPNLIIQGLRIESTGTNASPGTLEATHAVLEVTNSTNLIIRRNHIGNDNNNLPVGKGFQKHGINVSGALTTNCLIEENQIINISRHAILMGAGGSTSVGPCEVRRNYINGMYGAPGADTVELGVEAISCYSCNHVLEENNIIEDWGANDGGISHTINASGVTDDVKIIGDMTINSGQFAKIDPRSPYGISNTPQNVLIKESVSVGDRGAGQFTHLWNRAGSIGGVYSHVSFLKPNHSMTRGIWQDTPESAVESDQTARTWSWALSNSVIDGSGSGGTGLVVDDPASLAGGCDGLGCLGNFSVTKTWFNGYTTLRTPASDTSYLATTNVANTNSAHDPCFLWCPDLSNCDNTAADGLDMGATVEYMWENGAITSKPLWDTGTGELVSTIPLPVIAGLTDDVSMPHNQRNVGQRFHVGAGNGCAFRSSYLTPPTPTNTATNSPTFTPSQTFTVTNTFTRTNTPTNTFTPTITNTPTSGPSPTPTRTPTPATGQFYIQFPGNPTWFGPYTLPITFNANRRVRIRTASEPPPEATEVP